MLNLRGSLSILLLGVLILTILPIHFARAESITFTESDTHHKPVIRWCLSLTQPTYPYACGYASTTPTEETLHYNPGNSDPTKGPLDGPSCAWTVEATKVTVSFPDTPDASVIGAGNWLAAGMFLTGWDHSVEHQDWAYYSVLVLDSEGGLWFDVGIYRDDEGNGMYYDVCIKTWSITGLARGTPVTLFACWIDNKVEWCLTITGTFYYPSGASFDMSTQYDPFNSFVVGWHNIFYPVPKNAPYFCCYYFQFGIMSLNAITQGGWNALLEYPQWYKDYEWHRVQRAQTMQGSYAYLDSMWLWGGKDAFVEIKCHNNDASMERYKVKFFNWYPGLASNYELWSHEPATPPAPSGPTSGYTGAYDFYTACTTDPEGTNIQYWFYWGDGTYYTTSFWPSGTTLGVLHSWSSAGTYYVQVCAFDSDGLQSDWSPKLKVSISKPPSGGGCCPYVSTWNGTAYVLDNSLLQTSESFGADVTDYYMLQQMLAQREDGTCSLLLSELKNEYAFFDRVQLMAVDHQSNVSVAVSPSGEILTYTNPSPLLSAIDDNNQNVKKLLNSIDGNYYEGYNGSYITLNFGDLDVSQGAKLVIRAATDPKKSIHVQVQDKKGNWNDVATIIPRTYWTTEIIDMSKYLPDAKGNLKVRIYFTANHKIDFVGLDTSPQATIHAQEGQLISAIHSTDGDIKIKLLYSDETYAELVPGQSTELIFTLPTQTMEERNFIIITEGHYYTMP